MDRIWFFASEPPTRTLIRILLRLTRNVLGATFPHFSLSATFDALAYNPYGNGVLTACKLARRFAMSEISAIEFGVAGGNGLLNLARYANLLSARHGIRIEVFGFDSGHGLPVSDDYRDAPWLWNPGDFPPCEVAVQLPANAKLLLGDIAQTFPAWLAEEHPPIAFVSIDVDYYSSANAILDAFRRCAISRLAPIVEMYFDDLKRFLTPDCVGEMQAIREFNSRSSARRIEPANWMSNERPFSEASWLSRMFELYSFDHPSLLVREQREALSFDLVV